MREMWRCAEELVLTWIAHSPTSSYDLRVGRSYEVQSYSRVHSSYATCRCAAFERSNEIQIDFESPGTCGQDRDSHENRSGCEHAHRSEFGDEGATGDAAGD